MSAASNPICGHAVARLNRTPVRCRAECSGRLSGYQGLRPGWGLRRVALPVPEHPDGTARAGRTGRGLRGVITARRS